MSELDADLGLDLSEILADDTLSLKIRGKTYSIPPLGYQGGLKIKLATEASLEDRDARPMSDEEFQQLVLGDALQQMRDDDLPATWIVRAAMTAYTAHTAGRAAAALLWKNGPDPEALAREMRAAIEAAAGSTTSRGTGAAGSSTKKPANTSGTTSKVRKSPKVSRSRGATSPASGH